MRQRRQRLQVSTFPFLAVLLCAMGSLILLLLVIDRRAKVVARAKAMRALEQAAARDEKAAAAQRAEWERRRQMLHEQLVQQDEQVLRELQAVQTNAVAAAANVQAGGARSQELQDQLQIERSGLARSEEELTARRAQLANTAQQADASRADLVRLTAELQQMERALADVKAARQRQQQVYSLVPYRGKRGDNRKPLYVECAGDELIFHPDRLALRGLTLTPSGIRDEIERRLTRQRSEPKAVNEKSEEHVYLLMLIRPNGIATYYQTLAALKGLQIDFGYEFIDQDWILDFSENNDTPKKQPWMVADQTRDQQPSAPVVKGVQTRGPSVTGRVQRGYQGLPSSGTISGRPVGILASGSSPSQSPPSAGGESTGERAGPGKPFLGSGSFGVSRESEFGAITAGASTAGVQPVGVQRGVGNAVSGAEEARAPSFAELLAGGSRPSASREASLDSSPAPTQAQPLRQGEPSRAPGEADEGPDIGPPLASGERGVNGQPSDSRAAQNKAMRDPHRQETPGGPGNQAGEGPPIVLPSVAPNRTQAPANSGIDVAQGPRSDGANHPTPTQGQPGSGEPARSSGGDPLDRLAAQNQPPKAVRAVPLRAGLLNGNRDWIIPIECTADAMVLPSGQRIAVADLSRAGNGNNTLLEAVQRLIARRQATVRPGEPPYRPMIRFRVLPEGLRSYYLAYPALEALHVPLSRENIEPEQEKAARRGR